jgi:hypothetical protein
MKNPREAQVAWQICKLNSELETLLFNLYWEEFQAIYEREEAEKYWGSIIHTHKHTLQ